MIMFVLQIDLLPAITEIEYVDGMIDFCQTGNYNNNLNGTKYFLPRSGLMFSSVLSGPMAATCVAVGITLWSGSTVIER